MRARLRVRARLRLALTRKQRRAVGDGHYILAADEWGAQPRAWLGVGLGLGLGLG